MWTIYKKPFEMQYKMIKEIIIILVLTMFSFSILFLPFIISEKKWWDIYKIFLIIFSIILFYSFLTFCLYWKYNIYYKKNQLIPKWYRIICLICFSFYLAFHNLKNENYRFYIFLKKSLIYYFLLLLYCFPFIIAATASNNFWGDSNFLISLGIITYTLLFLIWLTHSTSLILIYKYPNDSKFLKFLRIITFNQHFYKKINQPNPILETRKINQNKPLIVTKYIKLFSDQYRMIGIFTIIIFLWSIGLFVTSTNIFIVEKFTWYILTLEIISGLMLISSIWVFFLYWKTAQYIKNNQPIPKWIRIISACSLTFYLTFYDLDEKNYRFYLLVKEIHFHIISGLIFILWLVIFYFLFQNNSLLWLEILLPITIFLETIRITLSIFIWKYRGTNSKLLKILTIVTLNYRSYRLYQEIIQLNQKKLEKS